MFKNKHFWQGVLWGIFVLGWYAVVFAAAYTLGLIHHAN